MTAATAESFADLLKHYRTAAGLSQEDLAEQAQLSGRAISDLERGVRRYPYPHTVQKLVQALALDQKAATRLHRAARRPGHEDRAGETGNDRQPGSLPVQPNAFIGRHHEIDEVTGLLAQDEVRLLTLTSPGGVGKTRLALRVAEMLADSFPDGIVFVSLASLSDPELVTSTLAAALRIEETAGQPILERVIERLRDKHLLLVLDNFEHLLAAALTVSQLVSSCPDLTTLVTSRTVLYLAAEHEYAVEPLAIPTPGHVPDSLALSRYDAVRLFLQRARAVRPGFQMTEANAATIAEICVRLDGLPLAIELAASRLRLFPPAELLAHFSDRLHLLTTGPRDVPTRQQTLRNTIDWSYALLTASEQRLFTQLSVFAGGCTFEAAEAVCNPGGELDLLEGLASLVDKSLLRREDEEEPRLGMLETIREYAAAKLAERDEEEMIRKAHARYFIQLADDLEPELIGPCGAELFRRLDAESPNIAAAATYLLQTHQAEDLLRLVAPLWEYWNTRRHAPQALRWLNEGLRQADGLSRPVRARALFALGVVGRLFWFGGTSPSNSDDTTFAPLTDVLPLLEEQGLGVQAVRTHLWLANDLMLLGKHDEAEAHIVAALEQARAIGYEQGVAIALGDLSNLASSQGDFDTASQRKHEALTIMRRLGLAKGIAFHARGAAGMLLLSGKLEEAEALCRESLAAAESIAWEFMIAEDVLGLGLIALRQGRHDLARERLREALLRFRELESPASMLFTLQHLAATAAGGDEPERAGRLLAAVSELRDRLRIPLELVWQEEHKQAERRVEQMLGNDAWSRVHAEGRAMSLEQAVAYALGESPRIPAMAS